ncbi:reverse transcriptase family protein [Yoonia sp. 2307UL14-13]
MRRRLPARFEKYAEPLAAHLIQTHPAPFAPPASKIAAALKAEPGFRRIVRSCQRRGDWPAPDLQPPCMAPVDAFARLDLPQLSTREALADWLMLPPRRHAYFADPTSRFEEHGETAINHYHYHILPKPRGGQRLIEAPKTSLKALQRKILKDILSPVPTHPDAFGFVPGRDCRAAAARHTGEAVVICSDLQNFFPSIGAGRVFGLFRSLGYPHQVATDLTGLCTNCTPIRVRDRMSGDMQPLLRGSHLPQGAPTSPALSNLVAYRLDLRLSALAKRLGGQYSRYADDLAFSGDRTIIDTVHGLVPDIIRDEGFRLNPHKTRTMGTASRQYVTGLVVNQHINVDRRSYDRIKAVIHACGKPGDHRLADPAFRDSLLGLIGWVEQVNPHRGRKLRERLDRAVTGARQ